MNSLHVKKGDRVKVIAGKDKGKTGEIIAVDPRAQRVTVEGVNVVKRHKRESQGANGRRIEGGIISSEASNVQLVTKVKDENGKDKEVVTRVGYERVDVTKRRSDGSTYQAQRSVRIASKTGKEI